MEGSDGAIRLARQLYAEDRDRYFYPDQYNNAANWRAHYETTGPEILAQTGGRITHFVAGLGTSGTFVGTGRRLREANLGVRLISVQPDSPLHGVEGLKHMDTAIVPGIYDPTLADEDARVETDAAWDMLHRVAREEGLFVGASGAAALVVASRVAQALDAGVVVAIVPDGGERYLSDRMLTRQADTQGDAMTIELLYGRGTLSVSPPAGCVPTIVRKHPMPVLAEPSDAVAHALTTPVGSLPLRDLARGKRSACVLICDITRPVPNRLFLPQVIRTLLDAGVPRQRVTVLVATGLHRSNEGPELAELVGDPWVLETVTVSNHDATVDADHVLLGRTPVRGTVVRLDRRLVEAEIRIATGLVEPHFMAGWSGGGKVIAPGAAHTETITTLHNSAFMGHPRAVSCVLDGNPLHEEQLAIARMLGDTLAVNTVIDDRRRLAFVNFGEVVQSHLAAVAFARRYSEVPVTQRFHTVVTSAAGHPLDRTYYQTVKGMVGPLDILEPGGDLIVASACSEGMGSKHYVEAQRRLIDLGPDGFLSSIEGKRHADIDEWQTQMQLKPMRAGRVRIYTDGLDERDAALTGVERVTDLAAAVADSMARHRDPRVAFVPEGPYVVPVHAP